MQKNILETRELSKVYREQKAVKCSLYSGAGEYRLWPAWCKWGRKIDTVENDCGNCPSDSGEYSGGWRSMEQEVIK